MDKKILKPGNIITGESYFCGFKIQRTYRILKDNYKKYSNWIQVEWYSEYDIRCKSINQIFLKTDRVNIDEELIRKPFLSEFFKFQIHQTGFSLQKG